MKTLVALLLVFTIASAGNIQEFLEKGREIYRNNECFQQTMRDSFIELSHMMTKYK